MVAHGVEVRLFVHLGSTPSVDGHPAELPEALTNLILNAVDALPRGGDIILTTRAAAGGVASSRRTSGGCTGWTGSCRSSFASRTFGRSSPASS